MKGRALVAGTATGPALVLGEPLSLWGGADPRSGAIVDEHHPRRGARLSGRVLVMPSGRGSSSSSATLAEMVRRRTNPAALILGEADPILALGAIVARELYGVTVPVVVLPPQAFDGITEGDALSVGTDGGIELTAQRGHRSPTVKP